MTGCQRRPKQQKGNQNMKNQNIHYRRTVLLIALVLGCFSLSPALQAADHPAGSIVGLWSVHYVSTTGGPEVLTYDQWHRDGIEIETPNIGPGVCMGTFKQAPDGSIHDYHVAWTFDSTLAPSGYWDENMIVTVSADRQSYSGTYARDFYDVNGNFLFEDDGTLTATRLTVNQD
jgi:hypothetical protein